MKNFLFKISIIAVLLCISIFLMSCKDEGEGSTVKPLVDPDDTTGNILTYDPDEMVELITDTTWFEGCGCLKERNPEPISLNFCENKVWFVVDTLTAAPSHCIGTLQYISDSWRELKNASEKVLEQQGYKDFPYYDCPQAVLITNKTPCDNVLFLRLTRANLHICNFPVDKLKNIKTPYGCEVTIKGIVYDPAWLPSSEFDNGWYERNYYDLLLTSFKVPRKYVIEEGE